MAVSKTTLTTSIGGFNRGPITELFVPPTSCLETLTSGVSQGYLFAGHFSNSYFDPLCYPLGSVGTSGLEISTAFDFYYYSPAICPSGWATATTFSGSAIAYPPEVIPLGTDTSAVLCCPTGYSYNLFGHECASAITSGQTITFVVPTEVGPSINRGDVTTIEVQSSTAVSMDGVPIWWQARDKAVLSAASQTTFSAGLTTTGASPTSITSPPVSPTASPTTSSSPSSSPSSSESQGLSTGAKIAIGVLAPIAFVAILAALLVYFRKRGVHKKDTKATDHDLIVRPPYESDSTPVYELHQQPAVAYKDRSYELAAGNNW